MESRGVRVTFLRSMKRRWTSRCLALRASAGGCLPSALSVSFAPCAASRSEDGDADKELIPSSSIIRPESSVRAGHWAGTFIRGIRCLLSKIGGRTGFML